jgi:ACR3 family arsenite efflux pump ArsB
VIILWVNKIFSQNEAPVTFSPQFSLCLAGCALFGLFMQHSQEKPFILIGAVVVGIIINRLLDGGLPNLFWLVNAGLFVVVTAIMLFVEVKEVGRAFTKIKPTTLALLTNFVLTPFFAWFLGWLFLRDHPNLWAGVVLYKLTPCIGWYLIFIDLAEGDVPWGVALLPWNIVLQVVLLPIYVYLLIGQVIPIDMLVLLKSVGSFLFLPLVVGWIGREALRRWRGDEFFYGPFKQRMGDVKLWALVVVIIAIFASQATLSLSEMGQVALIIFVISIFFTGMFLIGLAVGKGFRLGYEDTTTLIFTTTARNSEAVIGVAVAAFPGRPLVYFAILLGPIVELPVLLLLSRLMLALRKRLWRSQPLPTVAEG